LLCTLDRLFDRASVFVMKGASFRGAELEIFSVETMPMAPLSVSAFPLNATDRILRGGERGTDGLTCGTNSADRRYQHLLIVGTKQDYCSIISDTPFQAVVR
ncbi:hypothetical protein VJ923_09610, partial [Adlercreutzia sp. R25]|uniref:hypothetical protein n=1 Tax=Adlercreutzia shanghongiae TaxID=3111773 RepID=UPI002DBF26D0